jgi:hypothetical protein
MRLIRSLDGERESYGYSECCFRNGINHPESASAGWTIKVTIGLKNDTRLSNGRGGDALRARAITNCF